MICGRCRIKVLAGDVSPSSQGELNKARVQIEAEMVVRGVDQVDVAMVKTYAQDLRSLLEEADFTERKALLRSFIK